MNPTTMAATMTLERPALDVRIVHLRRKMLNLSIEHCSERTIAMPDFWAKLEAGEVTEIDRQTVLDIADTLGCDASDLLSPACPVKQLPDHLAVIDSRRPVLPASAVGALSPLMAMQPSRN